MPKLIGRFLIGATALAIVSTPVLELGSRYYECPAKGEAADWSVCNPYQYPVDAAQLRMIRDLGEAKKKGAEPSREDLDQIMNLVEYEDMNGLNGAACGDGMLFVRSNLGREGRYFVARHELEHAFRNRGIGLECSEEEQCATLVAAGAYPVGFIETVVSSLYLSATDSPTFWCFLFGSWIIFRAYILGS